MRDTADLGNMKDAVMAAIIDLAEEHKDVVMLEADLMTCLGSTGFKKKFPERFYNCGIAEANMVGVAAGLSYGVQGTGWKDFQQGVEKMKNPRVELEYIQVPILANVYVTKGLALKAGVQFGFLVDSNVKMTYDSKIMERDATMDASIEMKNDFNKFDLSIPVGVSYEFNSHWVLDARYHIGLTKLNKETLSNGKDWKNGMFLMSVGYKFDL